MKLKFLIDKKYLLAHALWRNATPFPEWDDFKNYLWQESILGYQFLAGSPEALLQINKTSELIKEGDKLYKKALKRKEFKKLLAETEKYRQWLEKEWNKNEKKILGWVEELGGLKIPNKTITVFVTHPKFRNGTTLIEKYVILWGHPDDWKNYSLVYLTHELLHLLTKKCKKLFIMHALIELLADNEIRIRLNGGGAYFKEGKHSVGHPYLAKLEKKILPKWKEFIKNRKGKDLFDFEKKIKG
ncbi:MAG: hypothetical protein PHT40_02085 [Patescibacteria group bacterium]|nr:hypothetical protein [Patescibacteria group bacterium]